VWVEWVWLPLLALPQNGLGSWVISVRFGFMIVFYDCALHRGALCPNCPFWALPQVRLRVGLLGRFPRFLGLSPSPSGPGVVSVCVPVHQVFRAFGHVMR
jgi:hypothetical protein